MLIKPKKKDLIKENVAVRNESQQRYQTKPRSNTTSKSVTSQRTVFSFRKSNEGKSDSKTFMRGKVPLKYCDTNSFRYENFNHYFIQVMLTKLPLKRRKWT